MIEILRRAYRKAGFYVGGQLQDVTNGRGDVSTGGRSNQRQALPLAESDSNTVGGDNLFLVGEEHDIPAPCGQWPFIT